MCSFVTSALLQSSQLAVTVGGNGRHNSVRSPDYAVKLRGRYGSCLQEEVLKGCVLAVIRNNEIVLSLCFLS